MEEKKYPIGGFAPGHYSCKCGTCGETFRGDKRAVQCEPCALEAKARFDALSPEEQEEVIKRNVEAVNEVFKDWGRQPVAVWPLFVIDKATGERHEVNKIVYHPENEPEPHVWCDTWYGHHIIGKDCEWAVQGSPAAGGEFDRAAVESLMVDFAMFIDGGNTPKEYVTTDATTYLDKKLTQPRADLIREANNRDLDGVVINIDELWDEHSEYIDDDIDSLSRWAGSTVVDKEQFKKIVAKMWELFKQQKEK